MDNPAAFSKHNKNTIRDADEILSKYKDAFKWSDEPEDILEVGCANGDITSEVVYPFVEKHFNELIGSDISQNAVEVANKLHQKPKLSFTEIDITENMLWKKYEGKFGHIISFYTFHLIGYPERWSENLFKMLKPKGQFFTVLVLPPHPFPLVTKAQRAEKNTPWAEYMEKLPDLFTDFGENPVETIKNIVKNAGFIIDIAEVVQLESSYPTLESLTATGLAVNHIQKHLPESMRNAYAEDYSKKLKENVLENEQGGFYYNKNVLVLLLTKP